VKIQNKFKLSLVAAMMATTCGYAGTVSAPNVDSIEISGDLELKQIREKTEGTTGGTNNKRTAEAHLNIDAMVNDKLEVHTVFEIYDDNQANSAADKTFDVQEIYGVLPIMEGKGKIIAGLVSNAPYGTEAFDNGGEAWRLAIFAPVAQGIKVGVVSKVEKEKDASDDKGDSGATVVRVDGKFGDIQAGLKYASMYANKDDGQTPVAAADKEKEVELLSGYIMGSAMGVDFGAEYLTQDVEMVGATTQPKDPKAYFVNASTAFGSFSTGVSYMDLSNGAKAGDDYEPGVIFDGEDIASSATKDTTALVIPFGYDFGNGLSANAAYINADIMDEDITEIDLGVAYTLNDNVELALGYGDWDSKIDANDKQNIELVMTVTF